MLYTTENRGKSGVACSNLFFENYEQLSNFAFFRYITATKVLVVNAWTRCLVSATGSTRNEQLSNFASRLSNSGVMLDG